MSAQSNAPVIIKRKKIVAGDGHHGGAWKVAISISLCREALLRRVCERPWGAGSSAILTDAIRWILDRGAPSSCMRCVIWLVANT